MLDTMGTMLKPPTEWPVDSGTLEATTNHWARTTSVGCHQVVGLGATEPQLDIGPAALFHSVVS